MPIAFTSAPADRYVIFVKESTDKGRRVIMLFEGEFTMEECVAFVMRYPTEIITAANKHTIPINTDCFQNDISVQVRGFTLLAGTPEWLENWTDVYGGTLRFIDGYTFNVTRHVLFQYIRGI